MSSVMNGIDWMFERVVFVSLWCVEGVVGIFRPSPDIAIESLETKTLFANEEVEEEVSPRDEGAGFRSIAHILFSSEQEQSPQTQVVDVPLVQTSAGTHADTSVKNTVMYTNTVSVPLFAHPLLGYDTRLATIPYGEMLIVLESNEQFYRVIWRTSEGWVLKSDLEMQPFGIFPQFANGEKNEVDHRNTTQVRAILDDEFGLNRSDLPLQAGEYVLYRLWRKGIHIDWPATRPRVPGTWHRILRGQPHIHIGVVPKVSALMEYALPSEAGQLAFVESVAPDESMTISEVNMPDSGTYVERTLTKEEWRELHPLFIEVSR